jgi:nicotinamide mononucleotide transporter
MSLIEWIAAALGAVCVVLVVRRSLWNYPFAILSVALLGWVFLHARLYSDALLQLFYVGINAYGWWSWRRSRERSGEVVVERLSGARRLGWAAGCIVVTLAWGALMHRLTDTPRPWWDAAVAIPSIAAQLLLARRLVENWAVWIVVDCLAVPLYVAQGLWAAAGLYVIYLALSAWGLVDWHRIARAQGPAAA